MEYGATGRLNLLESTLAGNSATDGGALLLDGATAFLRQVTLADNSAAGGGAIALESSAAATILQSTIVENQASANGGGLKISSSNVLLQNALIADNSATTAYPDVDGAVLAASSYNLISDGTGMSGISDGSQGNQVGTSGTPIDALLGTLGDHGGPVQTVSLRVDSPALDAGSDDLALTRPGRSSSVVYDALGRVVGQVATDPDGIGSEEAPVTTYWTFDPLGRVATETINVSSTDLTRTFSYDARGNLVRKVDRNGRVIDYAYDALSRQTTETWYDNLTDADAQQNVRKTYSMEYDPARRVAAIGDGDYDFEYTYSIFGNLTSTTQDLYGLTDDVVFSYAYDVLGRKTSVSAAIGSNDDYVNAYSYDNLGRITQITQDGLSGGNAVAEKRVDFTYNDDGTRATISRFADLAGTKAVAETERVFDLLGRVTDIVHERAATDFADYDLTWDAAGRISDFDFTSLVGDEGTADYAYDDTNQLTGADYDFQTDESYVYDENGNRTLVNGSTSYTTGDHNRLTSDGTYNYTYDNEGNVLTKTNISTSESTEYTWDHRNRLVKVTFKNSGGTPTKIVEYAYDYRQRWVRKTLDTDGDSTIESSQLFVHDDGQIVLDFQKTGTSAASNSDLAHRYLWGNSVDQLLADETVDDGAEDDVAYVLTDHLNSVRDLVVYDPITGTVSVVKHVTFDAFGNVTSDSATGVKSLLLYTARPFDPDTDLQNNLNRWYDLSIGRWMSTDPIAFQAGDVNLYRYAVNHPASTIDPFGLQECPPICPPCPPIYPPCPPPSEPPHPQDPTPQWPPILPGPAPDPPDLHLVPVPPAEPPAKPVPSTPPSTTPPAWQPLNWPTPPPATVSQVFYWEWTNLIGLEYWRRERIVISYAWSSKSVDFGCETPAIIHANSMAAEHITGGFSLEVGCDALKGVFEDSVTVMTESTFAFEVNDPAIPCTEQMIRVDQLIASVTVFVSYNEWYLNYDGNGIGDWLVGAIVNDYTISKTHGPYRIPTDNYKINRFTRPCKQCP